MFSILSLLVLFQGDFPTYRVVIEPMSIQKESDPRTFLSGIAAIETDGEHLFLMDTDDPFVIQVKADGSVVRRIGGKGNGPGELGMYAPKAMAAQGPSVWILNSRGSLLNYYENGEFITSFKTKNYIYRGSSLPSRRFAFDQTSVVLPAYPYKAQLAHAYDYGGELKQRVGSALRGMREYLETNPMLNHTMWETDGTHWYALFYHRPILRKYDENFVQIAHFDLTGPELTQKEEIFFKNEKDPKWTHPKPHFTDFFWFRGFIYALSEGVLYQFNTETGATVSRTFFVGEGEVAQHQKKGHLFFHYLVFLDSGQLVLANTVLFGEADLWIPQSQPYLPNSSHVDAVTD